MKKLLIILMLTGLMHPDLAKAQTMKLVVWLADGSTTDVELYTEPKVTFSDGKLFIKSTILDIEYKSSDVVRFTYKGKGTGIENQLDDADYEQQDGRIVFHSISAADKVAVYRSDGVRIPVSIEHRNGYAVLPLSSIPAGVYLISVNGQTSKFVRK